MADDSRSSISILVIEDEIADRNLIKRSLQSEEAEFFFKNQISLHFEDRLAGAIKKLARNKIDIILSDLSLPDSNGIDTFKALAENAPDVPVIVLTGDSDISLGLLCIRLGAKDYIVKDLETVKGLPKVIVFALKSAERDAELAHANQTKARFLATMSHEIRTPLNTIIGLSDILNESPLDQNQFEYVKAIQSAGDSLLSIVNDILDYSKIEAGQIQIEQIEFSVEQLFEELSEILSFKVRKSGVDLVFRNELDDSDWFISDPTRIRQVLVNLVSNALKFTFQGSVTVKVQHLNDYIEFSVTDTGIGIPNDKIETIFESFQQVDSSTTRKFGGTGLGLAITKRLVELMNGSIQVKSEISVGSTFSVRVPLIACVREKRVEKNPLSNKSVLVVDDNSETRSSIKLYFGTRNKDFHEAADADSAHALLQRIGIESLDLILIDCQMPSGGFEVFRKLQADFDIAKKTIMILPPCYRKGDLFKVRENGLAGHLNKPILKSKLQASLATIMRGEYERDIMHLSTEKSLLIVDDDAAQLEILRKKLKDIPINIVEAVNGTDALKILATQSIHAVLTDVRMPFLSGLNLLREAKSRGFNIPFIFLTAYPEELTVEPGYQNIHCLLKPVATIELVNSIGRALDFGAYRGVPVALKSNKETEPGRESGVEPVDSERFSKILLVDDTEVNRKIFAHFLKDGPYEVVTAMNGKIAYELILSNDFDLVLMDMQMPVMGGEEATKLVRAWEQDNERKRLPIIALTANAMESQINEYLKSGCDDCITKPVKKATFLEKIVKVLNVT